MLFYLFYSTIVSDWVLSKFKGTFQIETRNLQIYPTIYMLLLFTFTITRDIVWSCKVQYLFLSCFWFSIGYYGFSVSYVSGVRVARSLIVCACFVDRCLSFSTFSIGHCVVCSSSIFGLWLLLWYLHTLVKSSCSHWVQMKIKYLLKYKHW